MDIRLIACDLDGTLLLKGAKSVSNKAIEQISLLKEKNVLFVAASGRQYQNLQCLFEPIKNDIAYICENGSLGIYQNKVIVKNILSRSLAMKIAKDVYDNKDCELQISTPDRQYIIPKTKAFAEYMQNEAGICVKIINKPEDIVEPILKVACYCQKGIGDADYWHNKYQKQCNMHSGRYDWLDFTPLKTDKGTALKTMLKRWNISDKNCMAFGDNDNDISMLQMVNYSIAVKQASQNVLKISKYITDTVEDTLDEVLQYMENESHA